MFTMSTETATFGAGCFWGVEYVFERVPGVVETEVGYAGGHTENPTYRDVCSHGTGHAEVLRVRFDPALVSFEQLLEVFWAMHDPTQVNRRPDVGDQYRARSRTRTSSGRSPSPPVRRAGALRPADRHRSQAGAPAGRGLPPALHDKNGHEPYRTWCRGAPRGARLVRPTRGTGKPADPEGPVGPGREDEVGLVWPSILCVQT
jgi:hypothetical protein